MEFKEFCMVCKKTSTFETIIKGVGQNYKYNICACKNCGNTIVKPNKSSDDI